jgi:hypothetical protein
MKMSLLILKSMNLIFDKVFFYLYKKTLYNFVFNISIDFMTKIRRQSYLVK